MPIWIEGIDDVHTLIAASILEVLSPEFFDAASNGSGKLSKTTVGCTGDLLYEAPCQRSGMAFGEVLSANEGVDCARRDAHAEVA